MTRTDDELEALLASIDELSVEQQHRLAALLTEPGARRRYIQFIALDAMLEHEMGTGELVDLQLPRRGRSPGRFTRIVVRFAAAAAIVLCVPVIVSIMMRHHSPAAPPPPQTVAVITDVHNAIDSDNRQLARGDVLGPSKLTLKSGEVELHFTSGATLRADGPAELGLNSPMRGHLERGRIKVHVPPSAHGFTVSAPGVAVVDLGTEFVMDVSASGRTDLHVILGRVRAKLTDAPNAPVLTLTQHEARRFDPRTETVKTIAFDPGAPPVAPLGFVHWSFDEPEGTAVADTGNLGRTRYDGVLTGEGADIARVAGRFGNALLLDGRTRYMVTNFPGIGGTRSRTLAFWVRVPSDLGHKQGYAIVTWGVFGKSGQAWQVACNFEKGGTTGAIRVGLYNITLFGHTDLRDDQWHHVAVVFDSHARQLRLYVDGKIDGTIATRGSMLDTAVDSPHSVPVTIGREMTGGEYFRGVVDELYLFDATLNPSQIQSLMKTNQPPDTPAPATIESSPGRSL